jgi:hypothetical protein
VKAGISGEFSVPGDDAWLGKIVDGFDENFPAIFFHLAVVGPNSSFHGERRATRRTFLIRAAKFVRLVGGIVSVDGDIVMLSGWAFEEMITNHVSAVGGLGAGHGDGDAAGVTVGSVVEVAVSGPSAAPRAEFF